jgi:hypothetical protein
LNLQTEDVVLNDKRVVTVSETTGLDEMIGAQLAGEGMNPMKPGGTTMQMRMVFIALSLKKIDAVDVDRPENMVQVQTLMAKFTSKQLAKIGAAYSRLNDDMDAMNPNVKKATE